MKRTLLALSALATLSSVSLGATTPDPQRMETIWNAVSDRLVTQSDAWFDRGDYPRIVSCLRYEHELDPSDSSKITDLGWMLENIEHWDEALAVYIEYRKNNPNKLGSEVPEASFYYQRKLYSKVPTLVEPRIAAKSAAPNTYKILARSYEKMNFLADSKRVWKEYIALMPKDPAGPHNLDRINKKLVAAVDAKPKA